MSQKKTPIKDIFNAVAEGTVRSVGKAWSELKKLTPRGRACFDLFEAIGVDDRDTAEKILKDHPKCTRWRREFRWQPFEEALVLDKYDLAKTFLKHDPDAMYQREGKYADIAAVSMSNDLENIKIMIANGLNFAKLTHEDKRGICTRAIATGSTAYMDILLEKGIGKDKAILDALAETVSYRWSGKYQEDKGLDVQALAYLVTHAKDYVPEEKTVDRLRKNKPENLSRALADKLCDALEDKLDAHKAIVRKEISATISGGLDQDTKARIPQFKKQF